jgi:hypothetical protein
LNGPLSRSGCYIYIYSMAQQPQPPGPSSLSRFHDHTVRHTTLGRTPLDEWPARRRDLSTWQHTTLTRDIQHATGEIRTHNPIKRAAADPRLRPLGHCDRLLDAIQKISISLDYPEVWVSKLLRNAGTYIPRVHKFSRNPVATSKDLAARRLTWSKFHAEHP